MNFERLNLQKVDQQDTPLGSEINDRRSHRSNFGARSDAGRKKGSRLNNQSLLNKSLNKYNSLEMDSDLGDNKDEQSGRKILYRVSKKIYTPEEIEVMRAEIIHNSKRSTKKFLHYFTSL